jgi:hypothetical protein
MFMTMWPKVAFLPIYISSRYKLLIICFLACKGSRFGKGNSKPERTSAHVQENDGKNTRLSKILSPNSTREWILAPHYQC